MTMSPWETFFWGCSGSVAVELVAILSFYSTHSAKLPARYHRAGFWVTRALLACLAGMLAVGYKIDQRILAINIGAATPLILSSLARGFRPLTAGGGLLPPTDSWRDSP